MQFTNEKTQKILLKIKELQHITMDTQYTTVAINNKYSEPITFKDSYHLPFILYIL